ncbi:MAG: zf-HC2 domain-containing protein [Acidobacteria bacterium]|nr:zf-HC2 domain-containing protein [Acidobacteriota bacterium]
MDATSTCDRREDLVAYLYGECEAEERERIEAHLAACERCAAEVDALRSVRRSLAAWAPPEADLGFRIVSDLPRREAPWWRRVGSRPAWGVAAAACVAAAFVLGVLDVRWEGDGVVIRLGRAAGGGASAGVAGPAEVTGPVEVAASAVSVAAGAPEAVDDALMRRIGTLIEQSERRQQQEFATRLLALAQEFELQRREDQMRVQQEVGALADYLVRVSGP